MSYNFFCTCRRHYCFVIEQQIKSKLRAPLGQDSGNQRPGDASSWKFDDFHGSLQCLHLIESGGINVLGEGELMFSLVRSPMLAMFCISKHSERMMSISTNSPFLMAFIVLALKRSLPLVANFQFVTGQTVKNKNRTILPYSLPGYCMNWTRAQRTSQMRILQSTTNFCTHCRPMYMSLHMFRTIWEFRHSADSQIAWSI